MGHLVARLRSAADAVRASFFFLPALAVVLAYPAARLAVGVEGPPWVGESTVASARAVLSTVAAATITFASITFSVTLLVMQQASNQLSPRVIHGLTRDPFNRRVIAVVMGTFTYCLVVLQRVRGPLDGGTADVPSAAVAVGVLLGLAAVLAVVAAIHHTSTQLDVSTVLGGLVDEALGASAPLVPGQAVEPGQWPTEPPPDLRSTELRFAGSGWVQAIDRAAVLALAPPGGTVRLETEVGRYAVDGALLGRIWPALDEAEQPDVERRAVRAVLLGRTRTSEQDPAYGVRQLVDVALRALSPGVNDPTTAQDAIFHLGTLLVASFRREPVPTVVRDDEHRHLVSPHLADDDELAELAVAELRSAAADQPTVACALLEMLASVVDAAEACGAGDRTSALRDQARLVVRQVERAQVLDVDLGRVEAAFVARFG